MINNCNAIASMTSKLLRGGTLCQQLLVKSLGQRTFSCTSRIQSASSRPPISRYPAVEDEDVRKMPDDIKERMEDVKEKVFFHLLLLCD